MPCSYLQKDLNEWKCEAAVLYRFSVPLFLLVPPAFCVEHDVTSMELPLGQLGSAIPACCAPQWTNSLVGAVHKPCSGIAKASLYSFPVFSSNTEMQKRPTPAMVKKITSSPAHSGNLTVWSSSGPSSVQQINPKVSWQQSLSGIEQYLPYLTKVRSGYHQKIQLCQSRTVALYWQFLCPKLQQDARQVGETSTWNEVWAFLLLYGPLHD